MNVSRFITLLLILGIFFGLLFLYFIIAPILKPLDSSMKEFAKSGAIAMGLSSVGCFLAVYFLKKP